jgi:hypothetical protein
MPLVGMMKMSFHEIVFVTAVRNRFMSAASAMRVLTVMRAARMSGGTSGRIRTTLRQGVFIHMPLVGTVKMPVMHIVDVTFVLNRYMPAAWTVSMRVLIVRFVVAHLSHLLQLRDAADPID